MDFVKKILSDPMNRWVFKEAKRDVYLVGGCIRDLLIGRESKDRDFALKNDAGKIARKAARIFKGICIEFKNKNTFRVVLKSGHVIDFSRFKNSILKDLGERDFTINAMAWSPHAGIIDPFNGERDLRQGVIRLVNPVNLGKDPLRILRAYRIATQLRFSIGEGTRIYLSKYSAGLKSVARERITEEFFKLIIASNALYYLRLASNDKVLYKVTSITISN
jgi:tRNA nucleotidyltransferase/poly(A) polymerase